MLQVAWKILDIYGLFLRANAHLTGINIEVSHYTVNSGQSGLPANFAASGQIFLFLLQ